MAIELLLLFLAVVGISIIKTRKKYSKYPPGPPRLPLLGSLPFIPATPFQSVAFEKLAKIYGDVVHVKLGFVDAVTFNSFDSVKEILNHDKASGRKSDMLGIMRERNYNRNLGIIFSNGEPWHVHRTWTLRTLRNFGFGKTSSMDVVINSEFDKLLKRIKSQLEKNPNTGIPGEDLFSQTMIHILWRLVTGIDYDLGDPKMQRLLGISDEMVKSTNFAFDFSSAYPALWDWFPNWFGKNEQMRIVRDLQEFARETIEEHRKSGVYLTEPDCYVDAFLAKMEDSKDDAESEFNEDQLVLCILDLFQAGGETSSKTMSFMMLYMLKYPNIQEKVRKEIDQEIGKDESITAEMRKRFADAAHFSELKWGDPYNFRPERFLKKDGTVDINEANSLVHLGEGKRVCLGAGLAESSIFIIFASLIKSFEWSGMPGEKEPSLEPLPGVTYSPKHFQIKFISRN